MTIKEWALICTWCLIGLSTWVITVVENKGSSIFKSLVMLFPYLIMGPMAVYVKYYPLPSILQDKPVRSGGLVTGSEQKINLVLEEFKPCVIQNDELGLTTYLHEDVPYFARPMSDKHWVDSLIASDDGRLVGVNFWFNRKKNG